MNGVIHTRVGYAGGDKLSPTYRDMGDHSEAIEITYDPDVVSYEQLLTVFWASHRPYNEPWSVQYRSAIFPADAEQAEAARRSMKGREAVTGETIYTAIEEGARFWSAETYHQKYRLQGDKALMAELARMYPGEKDFVGSTAAARINGYLAGYRDDATEATLPELGLSEAGLAIVRERLER